MEKPGGRSEGGRLETHLATLEPEIPQVEEGRVSGVETVGFGGWNDDVLQGEIPGWNVVGIDGCFQKWRYPPYHPF